ncbi:MAG TPA: TlpA disulfide reductase family protein [Candidatus Acidoferrales bacterium]|jgi:peroxiredoxin|nr:TlpA disulfide reductase family protein [Candidatus Acidoferrales bacterium]
MRATRLTALFLAIAPAVLAQSLNGLWDATVQVNGLDIPFRMEISTQGTATAGQGTAATGTFFNGEERLSSTAGGFENGALTLSFDYYAAKLEASLMGGVLQGTYTRAGRTYPFQAKRFVPSPLTEADVPAIAGLWEVGVQSAKGESAWRLIVRQSGPEATAAILRVDGDTGTLAGTYHDGKFVLSHFSGARPLLLEVTPRKDGTLKVVQNGTEEMTAVRSADARAKGLPRPTDPSRHTSVKDPTEPLRFSAPDLEGHIVSNTDARFRNKVVIVAIGGSWCPNCHDEAPFLVELYRQYHSRGLEIVALSFEEAEQLSNPTRLRAFIKRYGIRYPVLLAGEQSDLNAKLPQAVNLNAWPTTFFLGRDGRVRSVHAGFAGAASGEFHQQLKEEVKGLVERLLAENTVTQAK